MRLINIPITIICIIVMLFPSQSKAQYTINDVFGDLIECDTMTRGIFIVWWDNDFDLSSDVDELLDTMLSYRNTCLNILNMADPPNVDDDFYYNVYIHSGGGYFSPNGWGNGQGTDSNGYPFLTLPNGILGDLVNTAHETFHIFQYNATSPGYAYSGDSQWYIEASANWFGAKQNITAPRAFIEAESLVRLPHVPLWLSFDNFPDTYPENWQRYVHQYAMALFLYYLTDVENVSPNLISEGFFLGTIELPQEYLFNQIGSEDFRNYFINWAAHMTNGFDFITDVQEAANEQEFNDYADLADDNEIIETFIDDGTNGWYQPADDVVTNAWSFNTYKLENSLDATYLFEIKGEPMGSYGDPAFFQGKILVRNNAGEATFYDIPMSNDLEGFLMLDLTASDNDIYFIIASMPEIFEDTNAEFQLFPYEMQIDIFDMVDVSELENSNPKTELVRYNLLGQEIDETFEGVQIILYNDGTSEKIYQPKIR